MTMIAIYSITHKPEKGFIVVRQKGEKMDDLISRQEAIEEWKNDFKGYVNALNIPRDDYNGICAESVDRKLVYKEMEYIDELPSAQSEIIRCKDCLNWIPGYITDQDDFIPPKCGKYQQMVGHSSDDYCSYAERQTDGRR